MRSVVKLSVALFVFWCFVVPPEGLLDLLVGAGVALVAGVWAVRFLGTARELQGTRVHVVRLPGFVLRMTVRVAVASVQVLRVVIDPRLPIEPEVIRQTVRFPSNAVRSTYANAITVTPGTLTLDVEGDTFIIHCLDARLAGDLLDGRLRSDVERLFGLRGST